MSYLAVLKHLSKKSGIRRKRIDLQNLLISSRGGAYLFVKFGEDCSGTVEHKQTNATDQPTSRNFHFMEFS